MKKNIYRAATIIAALILIVSLAQAAQFWGSAKSNRYHYPDCKWAQKINPANLVVFKTPEDAAKAGYIPCKACRPPAAFSTSQKRERRQ